MQKLGCIYISHLFFQVITTQQVLFEILKHDFRTAICDFMRTNQVLSARKVLQRLFLFLTRDFWWTSRGAKKFSKTDEIKTRRKNKATNVASWRGRATNKFNTRKTMKNECARQSIIVDMTTIPIVAHLSLANFKGSHGRWRPSTQRYLCLTH